MLELIMAGLICSGVSFGAVQQEKAELKAIETSRQERIDRFVKAMKPHKVRLEDAPIVFLERGGLK